MIHQEGLSRYPRDAWRMAIVSITLLLLFTLFLYQQTVIYLVGIWNQLEMGNYAHGYLVLLISCYLVYDKRQRLKLLVPCPEYVAMVAFIPALLFWMVAALVDVEVLQSAALLLLIMAIVWLLLGTQVSRVLLFPVLYIVFAIPIWFPLSPILQGFTADAVFWLIRLLEIPALREENMIIVPAGRLSIEEACSGLRYVLAALTLGALYAYQNYRTLRSKIIVVLISAGAALLANIIRVFIVVYLAYETDMQHPLVDDHLTLGWYLFGGLILMLLIIDTRLHNARTHLSVSGEVAVTDEAARMTPVPCNKGKVQSALFLVLVAVFVSAGPTIVSWSSNQNQSGKVSFDHLLSATSRWTEVGTVDDWSPLYHGADTYQMTYQDDHRYKMHLFLGVYSSQRQGYELINDLNHISDGKIWQLKYQRAKKYSIGERQVLEQLLVKDDGSRRLVWYWYRVMGEDTINKYVAKALQLKALIGAAKRASVVAISTRLEPDVESARKRLTQFIIELQVPVNSVIDEGR